MKYLIRSIKYFFYLLVILSLLIAVLVTAKIVDGDLSTMFVNGYDSYWQIALLMAVFAAIYPKVGYGTRDAVVPGSDAEVRPVLDKVMSAHGYMSVSEDAGTVVYRKRSVGDRIIKIYEDKVTCTRTATGYALEGLNKDVIRLVNALRDKSQQD